MPTVDLLNSRGINGPSGTIWFDDTDDSYNPYTLVGDVFREGIDLSPNEFDEYRAYFQFPTISAVPTGYTVTKIEFKVNLSSPPFSSPPGAPYIKWEWLFYMGTWIGSVLDSGDWDNGTFVMFKNWGSGPVDNTWIDLGQGAIDVYDNTKVTDFEIRDTSSHGGDVPYMWGAAMYNGFVNSARRRQTLRITYELLGSGTATGEGKIGTAAAVADFAGAAVVTGKGKIGTAAAVADFAGTAVVTGKGLIGTAAPVTELKGSAIATGEGLIGTVTPAVDFAGSGVATAEGLIGTATPELDLAGAGVSTGEGLIGTANPIAEYAGMAVATGRGLIGTAGGIVISPPATGFIPRLIPHAGL